MLLLWFRRRRLYNTKKEKKSSGAVKFDLQVRKTNVSQIQKVGKDFQNLAGIKDNARHPIKIAIKNNAIKNNVHHPIKTAIKNQARHPRRVEVQKWILTCKIGNHSTPMILTNSRANMSQAS
uniref:Uncharacterized protein n=1 Tax=Cacopsylla melanoneura TaxID=428564 RepID=A0A8D8TS60_9HEMI